MSEKLEPDIVERLRKYHERYICELASKAADEITRLRAERPGWREAPVFAFLLGEGPLEGYWFGEHRPSGKSHPANFWWRKHLRAALHPSVAEGRSDEKI